MPGVNVESSGDDRGNGRGSGGGGGGGGGGGDGGDSDSGRGQSVCCSCDCHGKAGAGATDNQQESRWSSGICPCPSRFDHEFDTSGVFRFAVYDSEGISNSRSRFRA